MRVCACACVFPPPGSSLRLRTFPLPETTGPCLSPSAAGLSCYAQPFGYGGLSWAWDLQDIALQINLTHQMGRHWDEVMPGRWAGKEEARAPSPLLQGADPGPGRAWRGISWERGGPLVGRLGVSPAPFYSLARAYAYESS